MPRYIDADERKQHIASFAGMFTDELGFAVSIEAVLESLDSAPTADVVKVVRCKDCKYWVEEKDFGMFCSHWGSTLAESQADDFCSYGERRK